MEVPDQRDYLMGDPPQAGVAYDLLSDLTKQYLNPDVSPDDWDVENYKIQIKTIYDFDADAEGLDIPNFTSQEVVDAIWEKLKVDRRQLRPAADRPSGSRAGPALPSTAAANHKSFRAACS